MSLEAVHAALDEWVLDWDEYGDEVPESRKALEAARAELAKMETLIEKVLALSPMPGVTFRSWDNNIEIVVDKDAWLALDAFLAALAHPPTEETP